MIMKRSRLEVCIDVLGIINEGCRKPTWIMYRSNTSWKPLNKILDALTSEGAITVKTAGDKKEYDITEKGRSILKYHEKIRMSLPGFIGQFSSLEL